jgi:hypothetical protein
MTRRGLTGVAAIDGGGCCERECSALVRTVIEQRTGLGDGGDDERSERDRWWRTGRRLGLWQSSESTGSKRRGNGGAAVQIDWVRWSGAGGTATGGLEIAAAPALKEMNRSEEGSDGQERWIDGDAVAFSSLLGPLFSSFLFLAAWFLFS